MQHFFELVSRKAPLILAVILAITVFFASQLPNLRIETSMMRMLVEDLPAKKQYDRFKEEFGGASDDILVVFKADGRGEACRKPVHP
jgi:predicted RND superfamily exporter protein